MEHINTLMKCGHYSTAKTKNRQPYCLICDCCESSEVKDLKKLTNRLAKCWCCGKIRESSCDLPFFEPKEKFNPKSDYDSYYCGCGGWD